MPRIIDMNIMEPTTDYKNCDILFIPKMVNGVAVPPIALNEPDKEPKVKPVTVEDITNGTAVWSASVTIDAGKELDPKDYLFLVEWWFKSATKESMELKEEGKKTFIESLQDMYPTMDLRSALKKIRQQIEGYHTYHQTGNGKFTARIKSIGQKIRTILRTYDSKGWYQKRKQ